MKNLKLKLEKKEFEDFQEYKRKFNNTFFISLAICLLVALTFYLFDWCCLKKFIFPEFCDINIDVFKDLLIGIIGVIAALLGFLFTAVSVFCSSIHSYYLSLHEDKQEIKYKRLKVGSYWNYIIRASRYPVIFSIVIIFYLIFIILFFKFLLSVQILVPLYIFGVGISSVIIYMIFDRIFDYFSNPEFI